VNAVEPETWAAARDAARRAGLSVGEWLEMAIRENAGGDSRPRRGGHTSRDQSREALEGRLDDIAEQLDQLMRCAPDSVPTSARSARGDNGLHRMLDALNERIDALMHEVHADRKLPAQLQAAVGRLDARLESLISAGRFSSTTPPELDHKLNAIARSVEAMSRRLEQENEHYATARKSPSMAELDAAIADITMRQSALDGDAPGPDLQRRLAAIHAALEAGRRESMSDISGLEQQLKTMAGEMQALRRGGVSSDAIEGLRHEVADLARKFMELAPRRSIEALEGAVDALAHRIDRAGVPGVNDNLAQVIESLHGIRTALSEVKPAESFAAVERDLRTLSTKLDDLSAKGADGATMARLQAETADIRALLANALPADAMQALVEQIELLAAKFERVSAPNGEAKVRDLVTALERRIEGLAERIENATQAGPTAPALETIGARIDALQHSLGGGEPRSDDNLQATLRSLADKVDSAQTRFARLESIERELTGLSGELREARAGMVEAAERAARSMVQEIAHGRAPAPSTPSYRSAVPEPKPAPVQRVDRVPVPVPSEPPIASQAPLPPESRPVHIAERLAPVSNLNGDLPADYPLEPGSGAPHSRNVQSAAERVALSEAALGTLAPKAGEGGTRTSDFIAAARRAAQAAAAESGGKPLENGAAEQRAGLPAIIEKAKGTIIIGLAAILIVYGAVRYHETFLPYLFSLSAPRPANVITTPPANLPPAPTARPFEPPAVAPPPLEPPPNRSQLPTVTEPEFASVPPAGVLNPDPIPAQQDEKPMDPDVTGSVIAPKKPEIATVRITGTPPKPAHAVPAGELPASIGTPALRAAALAGDPAAVYEIGSRWFEGRGVQPNPAEAVSWFERAIARGSAHAAYRLGSMHEKGLGIARNTGEARRLYLIAAEAGHAKAMHNLAVLYAEGIDGKPDFKAAARWFRMAADRGTRDSQYNLGVLYARGAGVEQNLAESYRWFALAATQGDADAAKKRDDVAARLDAQTLVAAKLAVQTWTATPLDAAANDVMLKPEWQKAEATPRKQSPKK
jgi:localization factor PodJL